MPPFFRFLMKYSRLGAIFVLIVMPAWASALPAAAAPSPGLEPSTSGTIYVPAILQNYTPPPPPGSFELIDSALVQGTISEEMAVLYKAFAVFGDGRLPAAYQASDAGGAGDLFMLEAAGKFPTLSASAKAILTQFYTPPYMAGSWAAQSISPQSASAPSDWAYISAAGGKARVWYKKGNAAFQAKAGVVAGALNNDVWTKETTLMGQLPILDGAGVQNFVVYDQYRNGWNAAFVPFGGYAGMTVPQTCSPTTSVIYINPSLPNTGNSSTIGIVETVAHEFMHALQFSFKLKVNPCVEYQWLGEATATWVEDFIYPSHNTEWRMAQSYLKTTFLAINDTTNWRQYGAYLLPYYFTKEYADPDAVRQAWVTAEYKDSLVSFRSLGGLNPFQVISLWNKKPFDTFFKDEEGLDYTVTPSIDETLKAGSGFKVYDLWDTLPVGGIRFMHYKVDPSVHTITYLNGLNTKITAGPYNEQLDNTIYKQDSDYYDQWAEVAVMVKYAGHDEPYIWLGANNRLDFCQDWLSQKVSEIVVVAANIDLDDRTHQITSAGEKSKIIVSSVPCIKIQGTATVRHKYGGETETLTGSGLVYMPYFDPSLDYRVNLLGADSIHMRLISGSVAWNIGGTDPSGCTYSGSDSFTINEGNNGSYINMYFSLLPGSKHYLGYEGTGGPDNGTEVTYTKNCPGYPTENPTETIGNFFMPDGTVPVGADGRLKGSKTVNEGGQLSTEWEWNFTPATQ